MAPPLGMYGKRLLEEKPLNPLLRLARFIDALNERVGQLVCWLVLAAVLISSGNAAFRYVFNNSSNAWLELQWYLFSAIFLFGSGYALLHHAHVRIDIFSSRLSKRTQTWIDILGTLFFLLPMALLILYLSFPVAIRAFVSNEMSSNSGGLPVWPARFMIPIGFTLLILQGVSELIKRIAFLKGLIPDPSERIVKKTAEEELAEEILRQRGEKA